jgi:hypothetical protein
MPLPRRPHRASPDEVRISREGDHAVVAYADDDISTTHIRFGVENLALMTDEDILNALNEIIDLQEEMRRDHEFVAVEIPAGKPQVRYSARCDQWSPRGKVVRAVILGDGRDPGEIIVNIDGRDFTQREFLGMVGTYNGWGVRLEFVPEDELHERPTLEVREPDNDVDDDIPDQEDE